MLRLFFVLYLITSSAFAQQVVSKVDFPSPVRKVLVGKNSQIFVGTSQGVSIRKKDSTWSHYAQAQDRNLGQITALGQAPNGILWVGKGSYYGQGIERLDPASGRWFTERLSTANGKLPGNYVTDLCLNKNSGFLITFKTERAGSSGAVDVDLNVQNSSVWLKNISSNACLCTQDGCFVGSTDSGLYHFDSTGLLIHQYKLAEPITALTQDTENRVWIGTAKGHLGMLHPETQELRPNVFQMLQNAEISSLAVDQANGLWIGNAASLVRMDLGDRSLKIFKQIGQVRDLSYDSSARSIWAASGNQLVEIAEFGEGLSLEDLEALEVIGTRQGLERLDYNTSTHQWGHFTPGMLTSIKWFFQSKNRFDVIDPLEQLTQELTQNYWVSVSKNPQIFNLIRRAYTSLSSLYSYYKTDPSPDAEKQAVFMKRFANVLAQFKKILVDIESRLPTSKLYRPVP